MRGSCRGLRRQGAGGLTTRIRQHVRVRKVWRRALLIRRPYQGFNSAEVGWKGVSTTSSTPRAAFPSETATDRVTRPSSSGNVNN